MRRVWQLAAAACFVVGVTSIEAEADGWKMDGTKTITLRTRDGKSISIGTIDFRPKGDGATFQIHLDPKQFTVFFLSMRNFQCIEGVDVECAVPYPYNNPQTATPSDLNWLADNLLFMYKTKSEPAAMMANGIRYDLKLTDHGIVGTPQAVNLDDIASPPKDLTVPPYGPGDRDDYAKGDRWIAELTIE